MECDHHYGDPGGFYRAGPERERAGNGRSEKLRSVFLLSGSYASVAAVAESCGFGSVYHFCRAFKQHTGCSPTEYNRRNRRLEI